MVVDDCGSCGWTSYKLPPELSLSRIPSVSHSLPPPADYRRQQSCDRAHQIHPCFLFLPFLSCQKTIHSRINTCLITSKTACAIYSYDTYNTNKIKPQMPSGLCIDHTQLFMIYFLLTFRLHPPQKIILMCGYASFFLILVIKK